MKTPNTKIRRQEKEGSRVSRRNPYYDYERFKKYRDPDPTLPYGAKVRKLSSELKI